MKNYIIVLFSQLFNVWIKTSRSRSLIRFSFFQKVYSLNKVRSLTHAHWCTRDLSHFRLKLINWFQVHYWINYFTNRLSLIHVNYWLIQNKKNARFILYHSFKLVSWLPLILVCFGWGWFIKIYVVLNNLYLHSRCSFSKPIIRLFCIWTSDSQVCSS